MNNKSGKKSGLVIFMLIFLIIVMLGVGVYAYFFTDLLKTPEQLFKKYFLSNVFQLADMNFAPFDEIQERSENEVTEYNLNMKLNKNELIMDEDYEANITLITDYKNRNEVLEFLLNKGKNKFFKANLALSDETLGLKVPDLYEKYIAIENKNLKQMAENLELSEELIEVIPDKIPTAFTPEEEEKAKALTEKYMTKIMEQFEESNYMAEKNINIKVNSKDLVANKYTLSISSQKIYTVVTETISELLDDPEFFELCKNNLNKEQLGTIKTAYKDMLKETKAEDIKDTIIKFSVYESDKKTVKTELKVDENEAYFSVLDNQIIFSTSEPKSDSNVIGYTSLATIKNVFENDAGELICEIEKTYNKNDIEDYQAEYDAKYSDSQFSDVFTTNYSEVYKDTKMKYIISTQKTNSDTIKGEIKFDLGEEEIGPMLETLLSLNFKCQFGKGKVEVLSDKNAEIINDYTLEDFQTLIGEITTNLLNLAVEKPDSLIGTILVSQNEPEEYPSYDNDYTNDYTDDYTDDYYTSDEENNYNDFEDITYSEDETNDNYMNPTTSFDIEDNRMYVDWDITDGLTNSLNEYKEELLINENADLGNFLTVDNVQKYCGDKYALELVDSTTIKCTVLGDVEYIYYALMDINGDTYEVTEVEVLTEEEYLNR